MNESTTFEVLGYFKEYYSMDGMYLGNITAEKDREVFGYFGRKEEIVTEKIIFKNKQHIKAGTKVITQLQMICGKIKN